MNWIESLLSAEPSALLPQFLPAELLTYQMRPALHSWLQAQCNEQFRAFSSSSNR
uniref:Uncharacterized protein n=1 Tax=Rhizophora mucronata TaxID=61149 RepID=A0A2P2PS75_RHIMU